MMRAIYTLLWWIALPFLPLRLWWRGRREPGYRKQIAERFGRYPQPRPTGEVIWIHAVSMGETRAAAPLIERLRRARPHAQILLTHMTATGRETGRALYGDGIRQAWLPYDYPFAVRRFLRTYRPAAGLLMETELWPNLAAAARNACVPLFLVNARLSERSARGYARVRALARPLLQGLAGVAAQTQDDADRLRSLGATDVVVTGNIKFDIAPSDGALALGRELRERFGAQRPVLVAASLRDGEEALLLDARARAPGALPDRALLVLVPRHPQRFDVVAELLRARGIPFERRSGNTDIRPDTGVVLGDSMGEMFAYYAASDVAFVGGSLLPLGGQNLIEPIAVGVPTLVGPHTYNFADASEQAIAAGAALRVSDAEDLLCQAGALLRDASRRAQMHERALAFVAAHRGAADRLWDWLAPKF